MGKYEYPTREGKVKGAFNIYQSKSGAIILLMGNNTVALTMFQLDKLSIDLYQLPDFDHDKFIEYYTPSHPLD